MKLKRVISGGQTGADKAGLVCAKRIGLETGGTAPKGYRTNKGPDYELRDIYGLVEDESSAYPPRTIKNVRNSDATLWFGRKSPGYWCTFNACKAWGKPFHENPTDDEVRQFANDYETWNIAGNRFETNPEASRLVHTAFQALAQ